MRALVLKKLDTTEEHLYFFSDINIRVHTTAHVYTAHTHLIMHKYYTYNINKYTEYNPVLVESFFTALRKLNNS